MDKASNEEILASKSCNEKGEAWNAKGKAIIMLATASGLRRSELANVKIEDIDWQDDRIRTLGKGRKEAYAPIGFSAPFIKQWMTESDKTSGSLFELMDCTLIIGQKGLGVSGRIPPFYSVS